jgi:hypothetical protein
VVIGDFRSSYCADTMDYLSIGTNCPLLADVRRAGVQCYRYVCCALIGIETLLLRVLFVVQNYST